MFEESVKIALETLTPGRVHVLKLPAKPRYPALVYTPVSSNARLKIDGTGAYKEESRIQVDCWAKTYGSGKTVVRGLTSGLNGFTGDLFGSVVGIITVDNASESFDNDSGLYRFMLDLFIHL